MEFKRPSGLELMCGQPPMDICTLLHSERPTPPSDNAVSKREGLGLALNVKATAAWRSNVSFVTIICGYPPTAKATQTVGSQFLE